MPWELIIAQLCKFYHCLPGELLEQPADEIMITYQVAGLYDEWLHKRHKPKSTPKRARRR